MRYYDIHTHLGRTSSGQEASPSQMVSELAAYGITKIGTSSLSGTDNIAQNNLTHRAMLEFPDVVQGYAFINPKDPGAIDEIDRCLGDLRMNGVKFHSWKHGYYADNTPQLQAVLERIQTYGVHVQTHVGTAPISTPYVWAEWAEKFPAIDFVFTHTGYYDFGLSTVEAVRKLPNVWVETSGQMDVATLNRSIEVLGATRVCFGTDWAYKPVNIEISKFAEMKLTDDQLESIFHRNAEYLWRLS